MSFYSSMRIDNKQRDIKRQRPLGAEVSWLESLSLMMTPGEQSLLSLLQGWLQWSRVNLPPQSLVSVPDNLPYLPQLSCCWFSVSCCFGWSASGKSLLLLPPEAMEAETAQTTDRSNNFILDFSAQTVLSSGKIRTHVVSVSGGKEVIQASALHHLLSSLTGDCLRGKWRWWLWRVLWEQTATLLSSLNRRPVSLFFIHQTDIKEEDKTHKWPTSLSFGSQR